MFACISGGVYNGGTSSLTLSRSPAPHLLLSASANIDTLAAMSSAPAPLPLQNKVALVTGSSRAIGAAIAKRLARDGASVVINYNSSPDAAEALVDEIHSSTPGKAVALKGDMSSLSDAQNLIEETVKHFGALDVLVLNAGYMNNTPLKAVDEKAFDAHFNINVKVPLFMVQAASKYLKAGVKQYSTLYHSYSPFRQAGA